MTGEKNILGGELALHCHSPKTGFYRDGYCRTGEADTGSHVIAAIVTDEFLEFTKSRGNDLQTPSPMYDFPGLKAGDRWCLCALRLSHPVFKAAPNDTKAIYVWDDGYFRKANYSLKRLIFIYETLCEWPIEIIRGNTLEIVRELAPSILYTPATNNPLIAEIFNNLKSAVPVQIVEDEDFVAIKNPTDFRRFFQYWNKAEKSFFQHNGSAHD